MRKRLLLLFITLGVLSCSKSDDNSEQEKLSNLKEMTSFKVTVQGKEYQAEIKDGFIKAVLPSLTDLTKLSPEIKISDKAKVTPGSNVVQDFTKTVEYTVTAQDKSTKVYKALITKTSSLNAIESFVFVNLPEGASSFSWKNKNPLDIDTLIYKVPYSSTIKALTSKIQVSSKATIQPASGATLDYSTPVKYTVKAEDGAQKEYLVIVDNALDKLEIGIINKNDYRGKKPKEVITFTTNVLPLVKEEVKVELIPLDNPSKSIDLKVESIDLKTKKVNAVLPIEYLNNDYYLKVSITSNNYAQSKNFVLDAGTINFKNIADVLDPSTKNYVPCTKLLMPGEIFKANMYLERSKINSYKFSLRKDGRDFPLLDAKLNGASEQVEFTMPQVPSQTISNGIFEFVVKDSNNKETVLKLTNTRGNLISVVVGAAPVVKALSKYRVKPGEIVRIIGDNLFFPFSEGSSNLVKESTVTLKYYGNTYNRTLLVSDGTYSLDTKDMQPGTFTLTVKNNLKAFGPSTQNIELVIEDTTTLTLKVATAEIFSDKSKYNAKQIVIMFNESIATANIMRLVVDSNKPDVIIDSFFTYPSGVATGKLPDDKYQQYYANPSSYKGYVVVEFKGKQYNLPFTLTRAAD
ncbi:DUF5018 domain-containing protein [Myroides sp. M-43]|uniref:DUF5018 domain-containing protein n=1 Tax=Myroides oncorhynchi TaxID=2893756 RepID=UPI001E36BD27|nr:DUF5018 domain-containing protein [Myroides oncorhynchi]MCC9043610.1 DUF5018 domain-containing protein [Myroides oncorhynchi]